MHEAWRMTTCGIMYATKLQFKKYGKWRAEAHRIKDTLPLKTHVIHCLIESLSKLCGVCWRYRYYQRLLRFHFKRTKKWAEEIARRKWKSWVRWRAKRNSENFKLRWLRPISTWNDCFLFCVSSELGQGIGGMRSKSMHTIMYYWSGKNGKS